jgi:hypothetical protein
MGEGTRRENAWLRRFGLRIGSDHEGVMRTYGMGRFVGSESGSSWRLAPLLFGGCSAFPFRLAPDPLASYLAFCGSINTYPSIY